MLSAVLAVSNSDDGKEREFANVRAVADTLLAGDSPCAFSARTNSKVNNFCYRYLLRDLPINT